MAEDFSWTEDRDAVVLAEQPRTAVYINNDGFVVIRQDNLPDDDSTVVIAPSNINLVVAAMLEQAQDAEEGQLRLPPPPPLQAAKPKPCEQAGDLLEGIANG